MWRPEQAVPSVLLMLTVGLAALRQDLSVNLELTTCARLAGQETLGGPPASFPKAGGTDLHSHVHAFYVSAGRTNPSPHAQRKRS